MPLARKTNTDFDDQNESTQVSARPSMSNFGSAPVKSPHSLIVKTLIILIIVIILGIIGFIGYRYFITGSFKAAFTFGQSDNSDYSAVFLTNSQVYFGKISNINSKYVKLTDIYYFQVQQKLQPKEGEQATPDVSLVKLGNELHGPKDEMYINRDQVLFFENMKKDSKVVDAIMRYKEAK